MLSAFATLGKHHGQALARVMDLGRVPRCGARGRAGDADARTDMDVLDQIGDTVIQHLAAIGQRDNVKKVEQLAEHVTMMWSDRALIGLLLADAVFTGSLRNDAYEAKAHGRGAGGARRRPVSRDGYRRGGAGVVEPAKARSPG